MRITRLQVENFRNLKSLDVALNPILNGFWGANGQGKTNILESIFAATRLKSFRPYCTKKDWYPKVIHNLAFRGTSKVEINFLDRSGYSHKLLLKCEDQQRWQCFWNEKKISASTLVEKIAILSFSPDDHSLVRGTPEERRQFVDSLLSDIAPGYYEILIRYQRALKQRNEILKQYQDIREKVFPELSTWTNLLAQEAADLSMIRREYWPSFKNKFLETCHQLFGKEFPSLEIKFLHDLSTVDNTWTKERYLEHIKQDWEKDLATGWTHRGPHRDDLYLELEEGLAAKTHASQSQARLLALALKWTHALCVKDQRSETPIFLIDDLSSELDASHRKLLLELIRSCDGQVIISGTEESLVDSNRFEKYTYWRVEKGLLQERKTY